jgi:hypothetical protein
MFHPARAHGDSIRLTATRSPRAVRNVWRRRVLGLHGRPCQTDPISLLTQATGNVSPCPAVAAYPPVSPCRG